MINNNNNNKTANHNFIDTAKKFVWKHTYNDDSQSLTRKMFWEMVLRSREGNSRF